MKKIKNLPFWGQFLIQCIITVVVAFVLFNVVFRHGKITSSSMAPTLNVGDSVLIYGLAYIFEEPARGDIIIFESSFGNDLTLIKRIVGIPGDFVSFEDDNLCINDEIISENYLPENTRTSCPNSFTVPPNHYFVLGDNRMNSYDSRHWTSPYVARENIKGKLITKFPKLF